MADDKHEKGMAIRTQLWGEKGAKAGNDFLSGFDPDFGKFLNDELFGGIWGRPGLPIKTRSMITMAALLALGRGAELRAQPRHHAHRDQGDDLSSLAVQRRALRGRGDPRLHRSHRAQEIAAARDRTARARNARIARCDCAVDRRSGGCGAAAPHLIRTSASRTRSAWSGI